VTPNNFAHLAYPIQLGIIKSMIRSGGLQSVSVAPSQSLHLAHGIVWFVQQHMGVNIGQFQQLLKNAKFEDYKYFKAPKKRYAPLPSSFYFGRRI
jgi:hypothetical protein